MLKVTVGYGILASNLISSDIGKGKDVHTVLSFLLLDDQT